MRFCPMCDNLLISKRGKLHCRTCDLFIEDFKDLHKESISIKLIKHNQKDFDPALIVRKLDENHITEEYRKTYEDFFTNEQEI